MQINFANFAVYMDIIKTHRARAERNTPRYSIGTPLLIDGCTIFHCVAGEAVFSLNHVSHKLTTGDLLFLFDDMVIVPESHSEDFEIEYVSIDAEYLYEIYLKVTLQKLYDMLYLFPLQSSGTTMGRCVLSTLNQCILTANVCSREKSEPLIAGYMVSLFIALEDILINSGEEIPKHFESTPWRIMGDFFVLLARHYTVSHEVGFYASSLCISPQYLNRISRECIGKSAKDTINDRLLLAMKALLESTNMSVKCIADRLHFEDSSYMCRFFRKYTGMSPLAYRKSKIHV